LKLIGVCFISLPLTVGSMGRGGLSRIQDSDRDNLNL
jgi:hypothetical protein